MQILEGVKEGDKVVASGAYGLPDKTKIKIEAAEAPAEGSPKESPAGIKGRQEGSQQGVR